MLGDRNRNSKSRVYEGRRYGNSAVEKAAIKKANEGQVRARELLREQERRENEPMEEMITADELLYTEFGDPTEMPNRVEERELKPVL
jgi:hypothetical protein